MAQNFDTLESLLDHPFDTVIDVRSPAEFAEDHVPGAISLPALSNAQRAKVGTIYVQDNAFRARKMGAAMVARNVADHIDQQLSQYDGAWQPLVYCWRGGQRSESFTSILTQIGWRAELIKGGYQTYRKHVSNRLYVEQLPFRAVLLDGNTGTAKTALLHKLERRGAQILDLEGMAGHRGSLLGATAAGQPAQKGFETRIVQALHGLDTNRPIIIEAESSKIGERLIPPTLWAIMRDAPRIVIQAPLEARARFLTHAYADIVENTESLITRIETLRPYRGHVVVDHWLELIESAKFEALAIELMQAHYDPAYNKSRKIEVRNIIGTVHAETLDEDGQNRAADAVMHLFSQAK